MPDIPPRHQGIPRSLKIAQSLGYKTRRIKFADIKADFIQFADHGSRNGSVCGVAPDSDPRFWDVCYKDDSGQCKWVKVPRSTPTGHD